MRIYEIKYLNYLSYAKLLLVTLCLLVIMFIPNGSHGKMKEGYHAQLDELNNLPRWCQVRLLSHTTIQGTNNSMAGYPYPPPESVLVENAKYEKIIGRDIYVHLHHYCWGINYINRYKKSLYELPYSGIEADRENALGDAFHQLEYVTNYTAKNKTSNLNIQLLMYKAYVLKEQGKDKHAALKYREIIKIKPGYAPAYIAYANLLNSNGKSEEARDILQLGLKETKGAKIIKKALRVP